jgi:hypothetical protein
LKLPIICTHAEFMFGRACLDARDGGSLSRALTAAWLDAVVAAEGARR